MKKLSKKNEKNENNEFINADDLQTNSLIHYGATSDANDDMQEIEDYIKGGAREVIATITNPDGMDKESSESDGEGMDKNASGSSFDAEAFLKNAKGAALDGMQKTASVSASNIIGGYGFSGGYAQRPYASPMLTLSDMKIPKTTSEFFKWCKYYYTFDPLISGAINACATFPVTDIYLEDSVLNRESQAKEGEGKESDELKVYKRVLLKNINLVDLCINIGIDYYLYGNCFIFGEFKTGPDGKPEWNNVIRLDPNRVVIDFNPVTQEKRYRWQVPESVQKICREKKPKDAYDKIPDIIKRAVSEKKTILLNSKRIYHFARPTDSGGDNSVWGVPSIAHVVKLITYRNILRQAQEAIAREHIVPMRIYYIQNNNSYNPNTDWNNVADNLAGLIARSVRDPNYKVVSPAPVGLLNVGGEGKQLLLTPEIDQIQGEILAGMNVPREFIFGGISYSGTSVSLRILENQFITYRLKLLDFINDFLIRGMAEERGDWTSELDDDSLISAKMVEMKMVDDVQQKQLIVDLNSRGKVTDDYMWKALGLDPDKIKAGIEQEAIEQIEKNERIQKAQIESQMRLQQFQQEMSQKYGLNDQQNQAEPEPSFPEQNQGSPYQAEGQEVPNGPQSQPQQNVQMLPEQNDQSAPVEEQAPPVEQALPVEGQAPQEISVESPTGTASDKIYATVRELLKLPETQREAIINVYPVVTQKKIREVISVLEQDDHGVDMRPMPEQKPPRREGY